MCSIIIEFVALLHEHERSTNYLLFNIITFMFILYAWGDDISTEASLEGRHTKKVQELLKQGFFLFILSEIMFFFALFSSYIYIMTHPNIWIGCSWPPSALFEISPFKLPLANAMLLVASGMWGELAHDAIQLGSATLATHYLEYTIALGLAFLAVQISEYSSLPFGIDDSVYGSLFFLITGFHGIHVCIGMIFIIIQYCRLQAGQFTRNHHIGFSMAIWYWHFVDIIWILVWLLLYYYPYTKQRNKVYLIT